MGGCDKTTPGLMMGAISPGLPAIFLPAGPDAARQLAGKILGSGSDAWKYWDERAPATSPTGVAGDGGGHRAQLRHLHDHGHGLDHDRDRRGAGPDAAGRVLDPGRRFQPSAHGAESGRRIVEMVWEDLKPAKHPHARTAFDNAHRRAMAWAARPTPSST
jgi:hypothetical protein